MKDARTHGFAMPLTLAVLVILSYIIATGLQRIEVSRAEARLAQATIIDVMDSTRIEQDVVWRGLLEMLGKNVAILGLTDESYKARVPENEWTPNARAFVWTPTYPSLVDDGFPKALVVVHDEASKIDLNQRAEGFQQLIADRAGLPSGQSDRAAKELSTYIKNRTPAPLSADDILRIPQRSGLLDPLEICSLRSWKGWDLCSDPEAFRELFTAGVGLVPNIRLMTPEAGQFLLDRELSTELYELEIQWTELRIAYGFYSPIQGIGQGGERFTVTIIPQSSQRAFRFEIDVRVQETTAPFAIRNRRYLPSEDLIADYRRKFPKAVSEFMSQ